MNIELVYFSVVQLQLYDDPLCYRLLPTSNALNALPWRASTSRVPLSKVSNGETTH